MLKQLINLIRSTVGVEHRSALNAADSKPGCVTASMTARWFAVASVAALQMFQFVLCGHPTPRCWTSQRRELSSRVGLFRSRLRTLGTHYHPTLDPAVLWTPSNDTSRPICSDSLNLMLPAPLYLRTLWRYTNAVIIIINIYCQLHCVRRIFVRYNTTWKYSKC